MYSMVYTLEHVLIHRTRSSIMFSVEPYVSWDYNTIIWTVETKNEKLFRILLFNQRTVVSISQSTINRLRTSSKLELLTCLSYTSFVPIKPMFRIETQTKIKITEQNQHLFQWPQKQIAEREIARLVIFWLAHKCSFVRIETRVSFLIISYHHIKIRVVVANWSRRYGPRCVCADHTSGFYTI